MKRFKRLSITLLSIQMAHSLLVPRLCWSANFVVYGMYRELNMGNPGEVPRKNYYLNMGSSHGLHEGSLVNVIRRVSTYNLLTEKVFNEIKFKVATLKVIHVERSIAVAVIDQSVAARDIPVAEVKGILIGDSIEISD